MQAFEEGDEAVMSVIENGSRKKVVLKVVKGSYKAPGWQYQLQEEGSDSLYQDGKWFREKDLRIA